MAALSLPAERLRQIRQRLTIELMVAEHVDVRFIWKVRTNPRASLPADVHVSGDHDEIGAGRWRRESAELGVQVAENVKTHERYRRQLFSGNPSACPMFLTGAKISCTSASRCWSIGSAAHFAHLRMLSGLAEPAIVVVMSGFVMENCSASF